MTEDTYGALEPLNEFIRLLKAIKECQALIVSHNEQLKRLMDDKSFGDSLRFLREVSPEAFNHLRTVALEAMEDA